jgi:hypothetical protein
MSEDKRYLVCLKIVEGRVPPIVSTRAECSKCGTAVWKAVSNPNPEGAGILCFDCMFEIAEKDEDVVIMPPTRKQIEDIVRVLKRRNN